MREPDETKSLPALVADLGERGVSLPKTEATRAIDTDAQSHVQHSVDAVLASAEREHRNTVEPLYEGHSEYGTPSSLRTQKTRVFMKWVAKKLAMKWQKPYSEVIGWVQARMSFAILGVWSGASEE